MSNGSTLCGFQFSNSLLTNRFGIAEEQRAVILIEQQVIDASVAGPHAALDEENVFRAVDIENRHAVDGACFVALGSRVGDVIGAYN